MRLFLTSSELLLFCFPIPFAHPFIHPHIEIQEALKGSLQCVAEETLDWVYQLPEKEHHQEGLGVPGIGE